MLIIFYYLSLSPFWTQHLRQVCTIHLHNGIVTEVLWSLPFFICIFVFFWEQCCVLSRWFPWAGHRDAQIYFLSAFSWLRIQHCREAVLPTPSNVLDFASVSLSLPMTLCYPDCLAVVEIKIKVHFAISKLLFVQLWNFNLAFTLLAFTLHSGNTPTCQSLSFCSACTNIFVSWCTHISMH